MVLQQKKIVQVAFPHFNCATPLFYRYFVPTPVSVQPSPIFFRKPYSTIPHNKIPGVHFCPIFCKNIKVPKDLYQSEKNQLPSNPKTRPSHTKP